MDLGTRDEWSKIMPKDMGKSNCPFCDISKTPVLKVFTHWFICYNKYPYGGNKNHLLLIPKKHKQFASLLSPEETQELPLIEKFLEKHFNKTDYFSFTRHTYQGRSLEHLHYHYLPGIVTPSDIELILQKNT
ncbi:MAG: HIT family protein [Candidatus Gracilibacteria bacterium]|nr:HIT family protein [Candidatus Gracilibacteria bacterium]